MSKSLSIGIDVGSNSIKSAVVDLIEGTIVPGSLTELFIDNKSQAGIILRLWAKAIKKSVESIDVDSIKGIGFAMPGPFDYENGVAMFLGNDKYEDLYEINIGDELRRFLSFPDHLSIRFHNDASCFALGEYWFGAAKNSSRMIAVTLGSGLGSAFIDDGIPIVNRADVPKEGSLWHLPLYRGIADDYFSTRWFIDQHNRSNDVVLNKCDGLLSLSQRDISVPNIFEDFGNNLGEFLLPWIKKFDADLIMIGGSIAKVTDIYMCPLIKLISKNGLKTKVCISALTEAAIFGSAKLVEDAFYSTIRSDLPSK